MAKNGDKLPARTTLTEKQLHFVRCIASGMLPAAAYRISHDTNAGEDSVRAQAHQLKRKPHIALALHEALKHARAQDLDSPGKVIADTLQDQQAAREDKAHAAVAAYARMRGSWAGIERTSVVFAAESLLSDRELIERLAGDDPARIAAVQTLLGADDGFPEAQDVEFEEVIDDAEQVSD